MRRVITSAILLFIAFSCNDKEETPVAPISFSTQVEMVKTSAKSAGIILVQNLEAYRNARTPLSTRTMSEQFKLWYQEQYDYTINIPDRVERVTEHKVSEKFSFFLNQIRHIPLNQSDLSLYPDVKLRVFTQDSIEYTLEEYQAKVLEDLTMLEEIVLSESELTDEEKIALISSIAITAELIPILTSEFGLLFEGEASSGRTLGIIKWVAQTAKKIINGVATVVYAAVDVGLYLVQTLGWPLLATPLGLKGLVGAAVAGGLIGAALGLDCVIDQNPVCYTCVFAVNEPNDPCYQP